MPNSLLPSQQLRRGIKQRARCDRAITVLSRWRRLPGRVRPRGRPQGHLAAVGVRSSGTVLVPPDSLGSFSSYRSFSPHIGAHDHESRHAHCHGLKADARVHINCARILEPPPHCRGPRRDRVHNPLHRRPAAEVSVWSFGLFTLIVGFDPYTGVPALYQIDPPGTFSAWKDNATGRNFNSLREFLAKNYKETSGQETVNLAIGTLLEVSIYLFDYWIF
ncbi:hypothetical protein BHM03_00026905 [Ensete ventricosum]|nr:hypothetical protein BHM03_00026905 [Ensete ventricosum]